MTKKPFELIELVVHKDKRGNLCVADYVDVLGFRPRRSFWVYGVKKGQVRGGHAHKWSTQFHVCKNGTATVRLHDGVRWSTVKLTRPNVGLLVRPGVWGEFRLSSPKAFFDVISSHKYDRKDYVTDFDQFRALAKEKNR